MTAPSELFPWASYALDAWQRSVLFLDVLRQRGNLPGTRGQPDAACPQLRLRSRAGRP